MQVIQEAFPNHAILGEEGGVFGDTSSEYLWCECSLYSHLQDARVTLHASLWAYRPANKNVCSVAHYLHLCHTFGVAVWLKPWTW